MRTFLRSPVGPDGLIALLKFNLVAGLLLFGLLEIWRPCYFLTDDNLACGFPITQEIGRHLKSGLSPFVSDYLFGGHYDLSRDINFLDWHPFYFLASLASDTPAYLWVIEIEAFLFLALTLVGFTLLSHVLVREYNPGLPVIWIVFYTFSFMFSAYILCVGASWVNFLANQSALPWLALGILERRFLRGAALIAVFSVHQVLSGYAGLALSTGICLTLFALGLAFVRRSPTAVLVWIIGNLFALLICAPLLRHALDGFAHAPRALGVSVADSSVNSVPAWMFFYSFFAGNWTGLITDWTHWTLINNQISFVCLPYLLACAAAWCLWPALLGRSRWRGIEVLLAVLMAFLAVSIVRPTGVGEIMHGLPILKSMRWPFREILQFQFFFHLFVMLRPPGKWTRSQPVLAVLGLLLFLAPMPFSPIPTFNLLALDRDLVLSGRAEAFWARVKTQLKPGDITAAVINPSDWEKHHEEIPYSLLNTANFPCLFRVVCISGYSPTAPVDQMPLKLVPGYWFGAFRNDQVPALLAEKPDLKLIEIQGLNPFRITLRSQEKTIDLTPFLK